MASAMTARKTLVTSGLSKVTSEAFRTISSTVVTVVAFLADLAGSALILTSRNPFGALPFTAEKRAARR
jgi:hypothetical protein